MKNVRYVIELPADATAETAEALRDAWEKRKGETIALAPGVVIHDVKTGHVYGRRNLITYDPGLAWPECAMPGRCETMLHAAIYGAASLAVVIGALWVGFR